MKELSIEQKAQRYDEAIDIARKINSGEGVAAPSGWTTCEVIFPELKENEDEKIRKELIRAFKSFNTIKVWNGIERTDILAWLEKQGEQKLTVPKWRYKNDNTPLLRDSLILNKYGCVGKSPSGALVNDVWVMDYGELAKLPKEEIEKQGEQSTTDKVEPKFKVGDVITPKDKEHEPWQITQVDISGKKYRFKDDYVIPFSQEDNYELVEQKPTNRIKPKFKVGDWIVSNLKKDIFLIKSTNCGYFTFEDTKGNIYSPCLSPTEDDYHLWTIQDAKNDDVLVCPKYANDIIPNIFIFKNIKTKDNDVFCYCSFLKTFMTGGYVANADPINTDFYPATKEQHDTLMKAMADAGYTFDFEKKELKKIIDEKQIKKNLQDNSFRRMFEESHAWSKEDCNKISSIKYLLHELDNHNFDSWFDSLKYKLQYNKPVCDEDNENYINDLIKYFSQNERLKNTKEDIVIWLKSLKSQKQWKPSDAQMASITCAVRKMKESACYDSELVSLLNDLKKLREE